MLLEINSEPWLQLLRYHWWSYYRRWANENSTSYVLGIPLLSGSEEVSGFIAFVHDKEPELIVKVEDC